MQSCLYQFIMGLKGGMSKIMDMAQINLLQNQGDMAGRKAFSPLRVESLAQRTLSLQRVFYESG